MDKFEEIKKAYGIINTSAPGIWGHYVHSCPACEKKEAIDVEFDLQEGGGVLPGIKECVHCKAKFKVAFEVIITHHFKTVK